ncbi:hypothetical protein M0R45_005299 [Rubus argutus]|uniref:Uncharacterized protein n=1 Tax=Rubus argutus TaxID=59490 RepID=A0AAW1YLZ6_RUBAR
MSCMARGPGLHDMPYAFHPQVLGAEGQYIGTQSSPVLMEVLKIATFLENWTCVDAVRVWAIASSNDNDTLNKYILHGTVYHCEHLAVQ